MEDHQKYTEIYCSYDNNVVNHKTLIDYIRPPSPARLARCNFPTKYFTITRAYYIVYVSIKIKISYHALQALVDCLKYETSIPKFK